MADLPFISKSDLEIFKALTLAKDISIKHSSSSVQTNSDIQVTNSSEEVFLSYDTDTHAKPSALENSISTYRSFKFDSEYKCARQDVDCVNVMCDLVIEKNQLLEMQICSFMKDASSNVQEIISTKHLYETLEQIDNTVEHIALICDKKYRIQQILQEKPYERTLKVNPSCQKAVLNFFTTANEIMDKLQRQIENFENFTSKNDLGMETHFKELQSRLNNKIVKLAKRIDIISQFRDQLMPASALNSYSTTSKLDMLLS